jgi:hypothetical protein
MNSNLKKRIAVAAVALVGLTATMTLLEHAAGQDGVMPTTVATPARAAQPPDNVSSLDVESTVPLTDELQVSVRALLSEPLASADGLRPVRFVSITADFNVLQLWVEKGYYYGSLDARTAEPIELDANDVNTGLAKFLAANIIGQEATHPYVREVAGPYHVRVQPKPDRTWGTVLSRGDLDISVLRGK